MDRESGDSYECSENDVNCVIVCTHILDVDNPGPFPKPFDIKNSELINTHDNVNGSSFEGLPCWFVKGTRNMAGNVDGQKKEKLINTTAIHILEMETLTSGIDNIYHFDIGSSVVHDFAIISRIQKDGRYFILLAGIHNIGTWIAVNYLNKVVHGEIDAPEEFLSSNDFIAIIDGDYSPEDKWVNHVRLKTPYFWWKASGAPKTDWKQVAS